MVTRDGARGRSSHWLLEEKLTTGREKRSVPTTGRGYEEGARRERRSASAAGGGAARSEGGMWWAERGAP
jgi:hypothetical protein